MINKLVKSIKFNDDDELIKYNLYQFFNNNCINYNKRDFNHDFKEEIDFIHDKIKLNMIKNDDDLFELMKELFKFKVSNNLNLFLLFDSIGINPDAIEFKYNLTYDNLNNYNNKSFTIKFI